MIIHPSSPIAPILHQSLPLQVDIGFGDAVTPAAALTDYPAMLGTLPPRILTYPAETVVAEKYHAMVVLDIQNSRMKDFYDIWFLARSRFPLSRPR